MINGVLIEFTERRELHDTQCAACGARIEPGQACVMTERTGTLHCTNMECGNSAIPPIAGIWNGYEFFPDPPLR